MRNKNELEKEIAVLTQEYEMERAKIDEKEREFRREAQDHVQEMLHRSQEGKDIEDGRKHLELDRKKGVYELEENKVENQIAIDETRKKTQKLSERNKGAIR